MRSSEARELARLPALRGRACAACAAARAACSTRRPGASPTCACPPMRAPRRCASSTRARPSRATRRATACRRCAPAPRRSDVRARCSTRRSPATPRVLELGCGTGQLSLFLAQRRRARGRRRPGARLARAGRRRRRSATACANVQFVETDLRAPGLRRAALRRRRSAPACCTTRRPARRLRRGRTPRAARRRRGRSALYNAYARLPLRLRRSAGAAHGLPLHSLRPVLRDRRAEPARREAWLRDQYQHLEEHRHTLGEVQRWFRENGIEYLRAFPSALLGRGRAGPVRPVSGRLGARGPARAARVDAQPRRRRRPLRRDRQPPRVGRASPTKSTLATRRDRSTMLVRPGLRRFE